MSDVSGVESQRLIEPRLTENEKKIIKNAANCKSFTARTRAFAAVIENVSMQFKNNVQHVEIENLKNYNFVLVEVRNFTKQNKLNFFCRHKFCSSVRITWHLEVSIMCYTQALFFGNSNAFFHVDVEELLK